MKEIKWQELGFSYVKTDYNVRCVWKDGAWGKVEISDSEYLPIHMAATCLHYGQEVFEGLKAFRGVDGKVRIFRLEENAKRMQRSGEYLKMQVPSVELFEEMCVKAIQANAEYIPPYGTGASLYLRPLLIGTGAQVGVKESTEYTFIVFVTPVGPYFKEGFKPITVTLERTYDRAAPRGTGHTKVGGNYAASIGSGSRAHAAGFANCLYLDPSEKKYIDEFGAANFFGIKDGAYITPDSLSVLPSITNMSLRTLAEDLGLRVENRKIPVEELPTFEEVGACGTAAVISPIGRIFDPKTEEYVEYGAEAGPWSVKLYTLLQDIQYGRTEDPHGWITYVEA